MKKLRDVRIYGNRLQTWMVKDHTPAQGRAEVSYRLTDPDGAVIFLGHDYGPSPMHDPSSDGALRGLIGFLTLRPGDTDDDYFKSYTKVQFDWLDQFADDMSFFGMEDENVVFHDWSEGVDSEDLGSDRE